MLSDNFAINDANKKEKEQKSLAKLNKIKGEGFITVDELMVRLKDARQ